MHLSDFDLQQLDEQKLMALAAKQKDRLLVKLLWDLKEARERLKGWEEDLRALLAPAAN